MKRIRRFLKKTIITSLGLEANEYHPLVWILGSPDIGTGVYIGGFTEINAKGSKIIIGDNCDIASFVSINCADSHALTLGYKSGIDRKEIVIGSKVFIGSHSVIKGGAKIGDRSVIAAGSVVDGVEVPAYSLVFGNPMTVKAGYYKKYFNDNSP